MSTPVAELLVTTGLGAETVIVKVKAGPAPVTFEAVNVAEVIPTVVGVPLISPLVVLIVNPAGKFVAE